MLFNRADLLQTTRRCIKIQDRSRILGLQQEVEMLDFAFVILQANILGSLRLSYRSPLMEDDGHPASYLPRLASWYHRALQHWRVGWGIVWLITCRKVPLGGQTGQSDEQANAIHLRGFKYFSVRQGPQTRRPLQMALRRTQS